MERRVWHESYPPGAPHDPPTDDETSLFGSLESAAARFPDRPSIAFLGQELTYGELLAEVDLRFGAALQRIQQLGCADEEVRAPVVGKICESTAPDESTKAAILEQVCGDGA